MESENVEIAQVPEIIETNIDKQDISSTHSLGLQDLYKAAFSQEAVSNFNNFNNKSTALSTNLIEEPSEKYFENQVKIEEELERTDIIYKSPNFDETYQLYSLKGLEYSVDFVKPQEHTLDLNPLPFEEAKVEGEEVLSSIILSRPYDSFRNDSNSVLDLDKGIQIHLVRADGTPVESTATSSNNSSSLTYNYENCEYTGDTQILQRYLCDSANVLCDSGTIPNSAVEAVTLNIVNKPNNNLPEKSPYDNNSIGVNPETLGVRFEDCDFNSSDSFASTESIIPKNIKCPKCPKKFMFKSDLLRHDKYKHSVKPKLFCKYCNKEFVSQQNLLFHEKSHKKKRSSYKCEVCKKVFKKSAALVKHTMKKHSKCSSFSCGQCGKIFTSQILLNSHFRKFHLPDNEKPFKCEICSKSFEKKQGLSCHAKAHLEEHPYICQLCNKSFSKICYLKNHQKTHQEEKDSFVCDTCGKDFKTSSALEEHSRKHTGEKPFTCNVCLKSFAYKAYFSK